MLAVDLIAATQNLLLHGNRARAEPKTLRYRLLHVAARLTHRIDRTYPLCEVSIAIRHLVDGHPRGKIVIAVRAPGRG